MYAIRSYYEYLFNVSPKSIISKDGIATGVELLETTMSEPDESGRQKVIINEGSEFVEEADVVIMALGFAPEVPAFLAQANIKTNSWGGIEINDKFQTRNNFV